jgi:hypothetical protein
MEGTPIVVLVLAGIVIYMVYDTYFMGNLEAVKSTVDGREYMVQSLPDKQKAADMIAEVRKNVELLQTHLEKTAPDDKRTKNIAVNFSGDRLSEAPANNKHTSYSINKGEKIVLCLRSKDVKKELVDMNTMMFVTLHEVGHLATESVGHTPEFWDNFRWILDESINIGIYKHVDYADKPQEYCGMNIVSNPLDKK